MCMCMRVCLCVCASVELQRTRYILLHIFINVFISLSVIRDQGKAHADGVDKHQCSHTHAFTFSSEGR